MRYGGRQKGTPNKKTTATAEFFNRVLSDKRESELWEFFLGHADPEVKFKAFRLSLEYKRGKPIQPMEVNEILPLSYGELPVPKTEVIQ